MDYRNAGLTPKQVAMLEFAEHLTLSPATISEAHHQELRDQGWRDQDVIDIVHIVALYSYMVRLADGLGVDMETGRGWEPLAERLPFKGQTAARPFAAITGPGA